MKFHVCLDSFRAFYENNQGHFLFRAAGGELQRIVDVQESLSELETVLILKQILRGVLFLHARNIAHLDIKPQNILLSGNCPLSEIKLCDFGISRVIQAGVEVREILGTPDYIGEKIIIHTQLLSFEFTV